MICFSIRYLLNAYAVRKSMSHRGWKWRVFSKSWPDGSADKESTCNVGDKGDTIWSMGQESPGEGDGYLLQYSCLKNPLDRGAGWTTVQRVAKSQTWLSN